MSGLVNAGEISGVVIPHPQRHFLGSPQKDWPVTKIHVKVGDRVKAGQCLVELDPAMLPQQQAAASLRAAQFRLLAAEKHWEAQQRMLDRCKRLLKSKAACEQEQDERLDVVECANLGIQEAEANAEAARVALAREKYDFDNYQRINSLIAGEVIAINCALGMVARAEQKQLVWVEILDDSKIYIRCQVSAGPLSELRRAAEKPFRISSKKAVAKLVFIPKVIIKGSMEVLLEADNPSGELTVGEEVKVGF